MSKENEESSYTAVVYFHGMGNQKRYEELSRLVDALDVYANRSFNIHKDPVGLLSKIRPRMEPRRGSEGGDVSYIRVIKGSGDHDTEPGKSAVRFYEVYWAPLTAGVTSALDVFRWLANQIWTPYQTITSQWRVRHRLRRAALHSWVSKHARVDSQLHKDRDKLLSSYDDFEGPRARREHPDGTFNDFIKYLGDRWSSRPNTSKRLMSLAQKWRREYVTSELKTAFLLITLFLGAGLGVISIFYGVTELLKFLAATAFGDALASSSFFQGIDVLKPTWKNVSAVVLLAASLFGVTRFLRTYMGDVQLWATYEETDAKHKKRHQILKRGTEIMKHVLEDELCERVVVIGHSLGSAIAADTLLDLGRYNRARNLEAPMSMPLKLDKIEHLCTLASPIDKIHYFFESHKGSYHRYNRVVDEIRGDIGSVPFAKNRKPHIHWLNFWDQGDVISGSVESPSNPRITNLTVDNVHVDNYLFPNPSQSHSGYFENRSVLKVLFAAIFDGEHALKDAPLVENEGYDYASMSLGPGKRQATQRFFLGIIVALPWIVVALVALVLYGKLSALQHGFQWLAIASGSVLVLGWFVSKLRGHLDPL